MSTQLLKLGLQQAVVNTSFTIFQNQKGKSLSNLQDSPRNGLSCLLRVKQLTDGSMDANPATNIRIIAQSTDDSETLAMDASRSLVTLKETKTRHNKHRLREEQISYNHRIRWSWRKLSAHNKLGSSGEQKRSGGTVISTEARKEVEIRSVVGRKQYRVDRIPNFLYPRVLHMGGMEENIFSCFQEAQSSRPLRGRCVFDIQSMIKRDCGTSSRFVSDTPIDEAVGRLSRKG